jgi:hypothetical protein
MESVDASLPHAAPRRGYAQTSRMSGRGGPHPLRSGPCREERTALSPAAGAAPPPCPTRPPRAAWPRRPSPTGRGGRRPRGESLAHSGPAATSPTRRGGRRPGPGASQNNGARPLGTVSRGCLASARGSGSDRTLPQRMRRASRPAREQPVVPDAAPSRPLSLCLSRFRRECWARGRLATRYSLLGPRSSLHASHLRRAPWARVSVPLTSRPGYLTRLSSSSAARVGRGSRWSQSIRSQKPGSATER